MTSPSGKKGKSKISKLSAVPANPLTTVAALFKRQLQRQDSNNTTTNTTAGWDFNDDDDVTFIKEETRSPYFSPKELKLESTTGSASDKDDSTQTRDCGHRPEKRLSRRLSLRTTRRKISGEGDAGRDCSKASTAASDAAGGRNSPSTRPQPQTGQSGVTRTGSVKEARPERNAGSCSNKQKTSLPKQGSSFSTGKVPDEKKSSVPKQGCDVSGRNIQREESASLKGKGKLSLKRKKVSQDAALAHSSPPKKSAVKLESEHETLKKDRRLGRSVEPGAKVTDATPSSTAVSDISRESPVQEKDSIASMSTSSLQFPNTSSASNAEKDKDTGRKDGVASLQGEEEEKEKLEPVFRVPYYLENFNTLLKSVFEDDYNLKLFDAADLQHLASYNGLSEAAQKLYVRLFSRKLAWLSASKIKYAEIAEDLTPYLGELVTGGLVSSGEDMQDLSVVLEAMSAPDLRTLSKAYHINPAGQQKASIIHSLLAKSQQSTVASLFGQKIGAVREAMLKKSKKLLGPMHRLCVTARAVFVRAMMLFSLINTNGDDDSGNGGQAQLFQMLMVNIGRVVYPAYTVKRKTQIFRSREDVIRFQDALQQEGELLSCTGSGNWAGAYHIFLTVQETYDSLVKDTAITQWDEDLPQFLRSYTAGSVLVRLLSQGVEIVQRRKDYPAAVTLIRALLAQCRYRLEHRGYWWDRLALNLDVHLKQPQQIRVPVHRGYWWNQLVLNLDVHLKQPQQALQAVQDGLADPLVRTGHRLALYLRAEAICSKPKSPFSQQLKDLPHDPLMDLPKVVVDGRVLADNLPGSRYQFITEASLAEGNEKEVTMCNVEQIVMDHYKAHGFPQAIHAEGSVVSILFCLFFWDVLFMEVDDAFHSPYQTTPLDFHTDAFYQRRQTHINDRLTEIETGCEEDLLSMLGETWDKQNGVMCAGMNWERFQSVEDVQGLVRCVGGKALAGILRRYAQQPKHTRGGFPDLTLWNTETKRLKISEVKGPGDRLSHKQMLWLDHLLKLGVDAEVCHVKPVGAKKLKPPVRC